MASVMLYIMLSKGFGASGTLLRQKKQQIMFRYHYSQKIAWSFSDREYLAHSLAVVASYEAKDPRDKIFAIRGLLEKQGITLPPPDYAASMADVYWQATKVILSHHLGILYLVTGFPNQHLEDAPSWVPDFSDKSSRFATAGWD
jgi:hypothetical protein